MFNMETAASSCVSPGQGATTHKKKHVPACLYPVMEGQPKHGRSLGLQINKLKRKGKETTEEENSPPSTTDSEMKSSTDSCPDAVGVGVPGTPPAKSSKNQKSSPKPSTTPPMQSSRGAHMKHQESPELRYIKPKDKTKDSGKKHQHTFSSSAVDITPSPERTVSKNTNIHNPGACALGVVNKKPRMESSCNAGVSENYYKPCPPLDMFDAALCFFKEMWEKYDASFRELIGIYNATFRDLMGAVLSRVPEERMTRKYVKNAKALDEYVKKYFSFPADVSESVQLVTEKGTQLLNYNKKGGHHLRDKRMVAKKLWVRVIVKILKKAKKVMRKKQKEMLPSGGSQIGVFENGEVETDLRGDDDSDLENSPESSLGLHGGPLESDIEDAPVKEPPNDPKNVAILSRSF